MTKSTKQLAKELGLLRKRPLSISSPRCVRKKQKNDQPFSHLIVIDFESTCWENDKLRPQEIIEFPAVLLNTHTGELEDEFHFYVQPSEFPVLSSFCQQLTGISQDTVDEGIPLSMCLRKFATWLGKLRDNKGIVCGNDKATSISKGQSEAAFVTWSDWDLGVCLLYETKRKQITLPAAFNNWIDLRATYRKFYSRRPEGLNGALKELGIEFEGREHSGLDDAKNTARLAWRMICDGCIMMITKSLKPKKQGFIQKRPIFSAPQDSSSVRLTNEQNSSPTVVFTSKTRVSVMVDEKKGKESPSISSSKSKLSSMHTPLKERNARAVSTSKSNNSPNKTVSKQRSPASRNNQLSKSNFCNKENIPPGVNVEISAHRSFAKPSPKTGTGKCDLNRTNSDIIGLSDCIRRSPRRISEKILCSNSKNSPTKPVKHPKVTGISYAPKDSAKISQSTKPFDEDTPKTSRLLNPLNNEVFKSTPRNSFVTNAKRSSFKKPSGALPNNLNRSSILQNVTPPGSNVAINANATMASSNQSASKAFKTPCQTSVQTCLKFTGPFKTPTMGSKPATSTMRVTPPLCLCGRRSRRRQVQNCGPNMGRLFFSCSTGQSIGTPATRGGCGFFQWESLSNDGFVESNVSDYKPRQFAHLSKSNMPVPHRSLGLQSK